MRLTKTKTAALRVLVLAAGVPGPQAPAREGIAGKESRREPSPAGPGKTPQAEAREIEQLIRQLGSDEFGKRKAATEALEKIGDPAYAALRQAAKEENDLEVRKRAERIVQTGCAAAWSAPRPACST